MNIVVDTSVWSLSLRREAVNEHDVHVQTLRHCVDAGWGLFLLGPILQELLDGLRAKKQFDRLLSILEPVPLLTLHRTTFVLAAQIRYDCRTRGVQAGPVDFLISAACIESGFPLLTADNNFTRIAACTELALVPLAGR